jgi:hypothetical protein
MIAGFRESLSFAFPDTSHVTSHTSLSSIQPRNQSFRPAHVCGVFFPQRQRKRFPCHAVVRQLPDEGGSSFAVFQHVTCHKSHVTFFNTAPEPIASFVECNRDTGHRALWSTRFPPLSFAAETPRR